MIRHTLKLALISLFISALAAGAQGRDASDPLESGFRNPPQSARPRVWWHWMNGNITKEGIKLDLDWMHQIGLAGFQNFDAALRTPQVVDHRLAYMTPEWKDAFKYAITLGKDFGMEMAIAGSPGWSETGGPWVPPSEGMKKYVWSETAVEGGKRFSGVLKHPPTKTGAFQNIGIHESPGAEGEKEIPEFYADAAVFAYKKAQVDQTAEALQAKITSNGDGLNAAMLSDGDLEKATYIPIATEGQSSWIKYEFPQPQTVRSATFVMTDPGWIEGLILHLSAPEKTLESSNDGQTWSFVAKLESGNSAEHTVSFAPVTARYFRVTFRQAAPPRVPAWAVGLDPTSFGFTLPPPAQTYGVVELVLRAGSRVNQFEEKAAFVAMDDLYHLASPPVAANEVVAKSDVVDLTSKMSADGKLDWTPPAGDWVIVRLGYSLLGITNHPATPEATGLEVDKLDHLYVKKYFEKYLQSYKATVGPELMGTNGIQYVINDSWEAGSQNWTDNMLAQFRKLRGYDPTPWLPVLTGQVVESSEASDRFLWDFRKTIADLIATEHYGQLEETLHEWKLKHYGESHEERRAFVADGMEVKKYNEIPMSAMWTQRPDMNYELYGYNADDRESASVAHIYGQNIAAAESMTAAAAPWAWSPATLKPTADQEFLNGINRFVIHESAHQPLVGKAPGLTLGPFGQWFNRNETWAEQAGAWIDYLSRTSFLLQQGRFGADLIYFYGEDSNLSAIFDEKAPDIPSGYGFDYVNSDALIHELKVVDGRIETRSGMRYSLLGLDPYSRHMSLPVLRGIRNLVEQGATVAGPKPQDDPSLADDQVEFRKLSDELFGDGSGRQNVGKGTVYAGQSLADVLRAMSIAPDFEYSKPKNDTRLEFVHRRLIDRDIYFVANRGEHEQTVNAIFRVSGKQAELWHAENGETEPATFKISAGRTTVPLELEPWESVFVVFRRTTPATARTVPLGTKKDLATFDGPWKVAFQRGRGAPDSISFDKLSSWSDNSDPALKYFSGTATYTKAFNVSGEWLAKHPQLWIDLGDVRNMAEVSVNGKKLGTLWHAPYRIDTTSAVKKGTNELVLKVTNAWVNRLIGDEQPGAVRIAFTDVKPYRADSPLLPSGLLGPVSMYSISRDSEPVSRNEVH
jgi:hypothetical protein